MVNQTTNKLLESVVNGFKVIAGLVIGGVPIHGQLDPREVVWRQMLSLHAQHLITATNLNESDQAYLDEFIAGAIEVLGPSSSFVLKCCEDVKQARAELASEMSGEGYGPGQVAFVYVAHLKVDFQTPQSRPGQEFAKLKVLSFLPPIGFKPYLLVGNREYSFVVDHLTSRESEGEAETIFAHLQEWVISEEEYCLFVQDSLWNEL